MIYISSKDNISIIMKLDGRFKLPDPAPITPFKPGKPFHGSIPRLTPLTPAVAVTGLTS